MRRTTAPLVATLAAVLVAFPVALGAGAPGTTPAAAAAAPTCGRAHTQGDIDGDGRPDVLTSADRTLTTNLSRAGRRTLDVADLGPRYASAELDRTSPSLADVNADGCADAVVAAIVPGAVRSTFELLVLLGSPSGLRSAGAVVVPGTANVTDRDGEKVISMHRRKGTSTYDLWLGLPAAYDGAVRAGKVMHFRTAPRGASFVVTRLRSFAQGSAGVPGKPERRDGFGSALAAFEGGVVVGTPGEQVGKVYRAGAVTQLRTRAGGSLVRARTWTQYTRGVPRLVGSRPSRSNPGFGDTVAVSPSGTTVVVAAPFIRTKRSPGEGAVTVFRGGRGGTALHPVVTFDQDSTVRGHAVPGRTKGAASFGSSLAVLHDTLCPGSVAVAVGLPTKGFGGHLYAGRVVIVGVAGQRCKPRIVDADHGLPGQPHAYAFVGTELGVQRVPGGDRLVITERGKYRTRTGAVHVVGRHYGRSYTDPAAIGYPGPLGQAA